MTKMKKLISEKTIESVIIESLPIIVILHYIQVCLFCLFGFNVVLKHLRSYHDGARLEQWYFDQCAATQECHAADTGHDTPTPSQYTDTGPTCRCANH